MTISNELSGEIATALLAAKDRSPCELEDLKDMLLTVHSTLQRLTEQNTAHGSQPEIENVKKVATGN